MRKANIYSGNDDARCKVKSLFNKIANYDPARGATEYVCQKENGYDKCTEWGTAGLASGREGYSWRIQLCPMWFNSVTINLGCTKIQPSYTGSDNTDQGAVLLHELLHNYNLFETLPWDPLKVGDGLTRGCYAPSDITLQASGTHVPKCGDLLLVASAYEYYALSVRASESTACGGTGFGGTVWAECQKDHPGW